MQVGVVGLGGLGHLAIQFLAKAVGAEVFAISHSPNKKEEALKLGATHFVGLEDIKNNTLDVVLNTTPGSVTCLVAADLLSCSFSLSLACSLTRSLAHSLSHSLARSLAHSLTHSLTHSLIDPLIHLILPCIGLHPYLTKQLWFCQLLSCLLPSILLPLLYPEGLLHLLSVYCSF